MSDFKVGYKKPPRQHQFKKGVCPNRKGRGRAASLEAGKIFERTMDAPSTITRRGKKVSVPMKEYVARACASRAVKGDVGAADLLLEILIHSQINGDFKRLTVILTEAQCKARGIAAKRWPRK